MEVLYEFLGFSMVENVCAKQLLSELFEMLRMSCDGCAHDLAVLPRSHRL
jgi:hypothetical protein